MNKKLWLFLVFGILTMVLIVGCGGDDGDNAAPTAPEEKVIRHNYGPQPESIDPALNTTVNGGTLIIANFEGLTSLDEHDRPVPGVAKSWELSEDGTTYTFHLREDAQWSDGQPVTAKDFAYAWKRVLEPGSKAKYAYQLFHIKNANNYHQGKATAEDLGIKVVDDHTLKVELVAPTPYFLNITAFPTLFPVRADIIEQHGEQWTKNPDTYIGNGPFKLVEWQSNEHMRFVKNKYYWNADAIKIDGIYETFIPDANSMLASYQNDDIDIIEQVPLEQLDQLKKESKELQIIPQLGTYYYAFNVTQAPFDDVRVRKAFNVALDKEVITDQVRKSGIAAGALVPPGVPDAESGKEFREVGDQFFATKAEPEKAKKLLAEAGYPDGKEFPAVTLTYNTEEGHQQIAEAALEMWQQNLGINNIKLVGLGKKEFIANRQKGDFQIARHGWLGDYADPATFLQLFITGNDNNSTQWSNKEFDELIAKSRMSTSATERMKLLHQGEKMILNEAIIIPVFHYTENIMIKDRIKNVHKSSLGFTYFDKAEMAS
ncbi:peptide ABC transporter substrate-binding protein [Peptococcaceae bacterium 1198_IL3148]